MRARGLDILRASDGRTVAQLTVDKDDVDALLKCADELREKDINLTLKAWREKRSLNANAYCWTLIHKLAEELKQDPIDIYRHYVRAAGVARVFDISEGAVDTIVHSWGLHGTGWVCDVLDYGRHEGMRTVRAFYGSSTYNTAQMSGLINSIVEDCKESGIETRTPEQIEELMREWEASAEKRKYA